MSASVAIDSLSLKVFRSIPASVNAWSVGANTVNGPSACSADTKFALASAATSESCTPVLEAISVMS